MLCVEKDDPREAPESGDKKPQPVKITQPVRFPATGTAGGFSFLRGIMLTAIQVVQHSTEMPDNISKIQKLTPSR